MSGSCGIAYRPSTEPCNITAEVKNRTGTPRWWCQTHGCQAWGPGGVRLPQCAGAATAAPTKVLTLDPADYHGGVGIWGALAPVYNWGVDHQPSGVHVHARALPGGPKVIDETFEQITLLTPGGPWLLDAKTAQAYVISSVLGLPMKSLPCPRCDRQHLDMAEFAVAAHPKHQCNWCGRHFFDSSGPSVANACRQLQELIQPPRLTSLPASRALDVRQEEQGGLAIWGSNEAIIWTAPIPEQTGIHVHAVDLNGHPLVDDTFDELTIDGIRLDPEQLRLLMVQQALSYLTGRIEALSCSNCGLDHDDAAISGVHPVALHRCTGCGASLRGAQRGRKIVSNPAVRALTRVGKQPRGRRRRRVA